MPIFSPFLTVYGWRACLAHPNGIAGHILPLVSRLYVAMVATDDFQAQPALGAPIVLARERSFRIGAAEFRPATREVLTAGETSIIEPRVMQLLIALHRAQGAVVDKDQLLQSVWDGRIVGDDAINRVVSRLRGVAESEAGRQFRIETITKVGYRLVSTADETASVAGGTQEMSAGGGRRWVAFASRRRATIAGLIILMLVISAGAWLWLRPGAVIAHSMTVRLAGFQSLSADLPRTMRDSINASLTSAFNVDGAIGVSTVSTPPSGTAPAYALDGTVERVGDSIRVTTRFTNERSGIVLWADRTDYGADQISKIPARIAVEAGTVVRCGLSGAATYRRALPDPVMSDYMRYCQEYWSEGGTKTLRFAQRVVAAVPDFSWGWSAVGNGFMQAARDGRDAQSAEAMDVAGREAEDKALALDRTNSEALAHKPHFIDQNDWIGRERLFEEAVAARPLDCGCEHYGYGLLLAGVGRLDAAVEQYRAATEMLALWPNSQHALADMLVATGHKEKAGAYFRTAIDLSTDPNLENTIAVSSGVETGDYSAALAALRNPQSRTPSDSRDALIAGYEALASGNSSAKAKAIAVLLALPKNKQNATVVSLLGALGANSEALSAAGPRPWLFWRRSMRGVLYEPAFPAAADKLGLMAYWKASHKKPDVCRAKDAPAFCRMI